MMTWLEVSQRKFADEITRLGGADAAAKQLGWSLPAVKAYLSHKRIPNYNTRISLAAEMGLPLNSFQ